MATSVFSAEQVNFQTLNFLLAGLQGKFAAINILNQIAHPDFDEQALEKLKKDLKTITSLFNGLEEQKFPIKKSDPNISNDEKIIFSLLQELKQDYFLNAKKVFDMATTEAWDRKPNIYRLFVAYYGWFAYQEDNFYKKLRDYHAAKGNQEMVLEADEILTKSSGNIQLTSNFLNSIKIPEGPEESFFSYLSFYFKILPGYFLARMHETNQMLHIKAPEFTYKHANFDPEDEVAWSGAGYSPVEAGYWRAFGFDPEMANEWKNVGLVTPRDAADWKMSGFEAEEAVEWTSFLFSPLLAIQWFNGGFSPQESAILVSHGFALPIDLPKDPEQIKALLESGLKE